MSKNLVIVESPAKAKTIEGYLGKDFTVKSSYGHVRDLPKNEAAVDIENGFLPKYEVSADKQKVIKELKELAKKAEIVWLATDEDREGEAISWHLQETLNLAPSKTRRIVFNEITKSAILKAIENPRQVDVNLVNAQQARRVLDRLVGFELSPVLWKKVKPKLSAGRVQSVAVRLIVERERDIESFETKSNYKIVAIFQSEFGVVKAELPKRFETEAEARKFLEECAGSTFKVAELEQKPGTKTPAAPFTTSTLQQEASRKLGFSVSQTMSIAQRLYESGKITYMRTDSVNLSETAINGAKDVIYRDFGPDFHKSRKYTSTSKGAQEAHEAIRPTDLMSPTVEGERNEQRLYDLIWKRTVASQMADARLEKTIATIDISKSKENLVARGEVLLFEGFLKVYMESSDDEEEDNQSGMLPPLKKGQSLDLTELSATQRFTQHPPRYAEASLVKKLEELGIGRPSTYASIISTIQDRGYVVKESKEGKKRDYRVLRLEKSKVVEETKSENTGSEKNKLFPTDIGRVVTDFLIENFDNIMDYQFTATVEKEFDDIAQGLIVWNHMIRDFYAPFHLSVGQTMETGKKAMGDRLIGEDPATGKPIIARIGRFGPMIQIGSPEDEEKQFASLLPDQSISSITLEQALDLFKLPRKLGQFEEEELHAAIGRFGPYIRHGKVFASIPKDMDAFTITYDQAKDLIIKKNEAAANALIKTFDEDPSFQILNGRYGPYIKAGKLNVKIPKGKDPASLTWEEVKALAEETAKNPPKKARKR
jgi:DNA topoisomerase-1